MHKAVVSTLSFMLCSSFAVGQGLAELDAAQGVNDTLNAAPVSAPGAVGGPNAAPGFGPPPVGGPPGAAGLPPPLPGAQTAPAAGGAAFPGLNAPGVNQAGGVVNEFGQPGQPQQATPTPEPTIKVLVGDRVYDAVTGALLEDPSLITVPLNQQDKYLDDGINDNGIKGDGIRGNVNTSKNQYIGAVTNSLKNRAINLVRNAEKMSPMVFYRYHFMAVNPTTQHRDMPNLLQKESQRDEMLREWNNKFLSDYRINRDDPRSEFFQLYVPNPPSIPEYPPPPGYVPVQALQAGQTPGVPGAPVVATPNILNGEPVINVPGAI